MKSDFEPILFSTDPGFPEIEIYFAHDIHLGSRQADVAKWDRFRKEVLNAPNRFVIMAGDYCENALVGCKGDIYEQVVPPAMQKEWLCDEMYKLKDRIIAVVPGNHENNRVTKLCGLYPVYDCAVMNGIGDRYRQGFALVDIGVGDYQKKSSSRQLRYFGFVTHRLKDIKSCNGADFVDGVDFAAYGHDHEPKDHPRAKLVYDPINKRVTQKTVEVIDSGSFLTYGGYAISSGYRPLSEKIYKLVLSSGRDKRLTTIGFHL